MAFEGIDHAFEDPKLPNQVRSSMLRTNNGRCTSTLHWALRANVRVRFQSCIHGPRLSPPSAPPSTSEQKKWYIFERLHCPQERGDCPATIAPSTIMSSPPSKKKTLNIRAARSFLIGLFLGWFFFLKVENPWSTRVVIRDRDNPCTKKTETIRARVPHGIEKAVTIRGGMKYIPYSWYAAITSTVRSFAPVDASYYDLVWPSNCLFT